MDFNSSRKRNRNISFSFLIRETFERGTNCENFCEAKGYEIVSPTETLQNPRNHISRCYILLFPVCLISLFIVLWSVRTELCQYIVHSFCMQFTFHTDRFQLKREISQTMTFCLYYVNTFVERYEKTLTDFTQFSFSLRRKVQKKPTMEFHSFILTENV